MAPAIGDAVDAVSDALGDAVSYAASWWKLVLLIVALAVAWIAARRLRARFNYFRLDQALGFNSDSFNLDENIHSGDSRGGLDWKAKLRIRWIMFRHGVSFDDARTMDVQNTFALNDVNPDGTPRDPKAFFFV